MSDTTRWFKRYRDGNVIEEREDGKAWRIPSQKIRLHLDSRPRIIFKGKRALSELLSDWDMPTDEFLKELGHIVSDQSTPLGFERLSEDIQSEIKTGTPASAAAAALNLLRAVLNAEAIKAGALARAKGESKSKKDKASLVIEKCEDIRLEKAKAGVKTVPSCLALVGQALNRLTEDKGEFEGLEVKTAFKGLKTTTVYAWRDLEPYRKFLKSL